MPAVQTSTGTGSVATTPALHPPQATAVGGGGGGGGADQQILYNVEYIFEEDGKQVRKVPIEMNGQTIWVECVDSAKQGGAGIVGGVDSLGGGVYKAQDSIIMELNGESDGLEMPSANPALKTSGQPKSLASSYSPEQRAEIIREVLEQHISPADVAKKYNTSPHSIRDWIKKAGQSLPKTYKKLPDYSRDISKPVVVTGAMKPQQQKLDVQQANVVYSSMQTPQQQHQPRQMMGVTTGEPPTIDSPDHVAIASTSQVMSTTMLAPRRIPGKLALCKFCGTLSDDFNTCSFCRKRLPEDSKIMDDPTCKPKPDSTEDNQKKASLRAMRLPTKNRRRGGNPDEPVCIALSSDEEDEPVEEQSETVVAEDGSHIKLDTEGEPMAGPGEEIVVDGSVGGQWFTLACRSVRIGNYKVVPKEKITITQRGLQIKVPAILNPEETVTLNILRSDVIKVHAHFGKQMPLLFVYISPPACSRARKILKMSSTQSFFLDVHSADETQKRITILPEKLTEDNKAILKQHFKDLVLELESKEANEILVRSSPKEANLLRNKMAGVMSDKLRGLMGGDQQPQVVKYCQFPPDGAGNVSVSNEDYACLEVEQFLNDVIIDFYLKYLQYGKYQDREAVLEKTHIFTTYFYKRLTTRPTTKNKANKHHPVEDDPNLTPAEKRYDRVRKWTKKVNLFDKDFVIVPINEHAHWFVCIICFPGQLGCVSSTDGQPCDTPLSQSGRVKRRNNKKKRPITIGSTTIIPLKGGRHGGDASDIRLTLDEDSERDEAEASEDDMEDESEEGEMTGTTAMARREGEEATAAATTTTMTSTTTASSGVKEEGGTTVDGDGADGGPAAAVGGQQKQPGGGGGGSSSGVRQPCILIFDSLAGGSKARTCQTLRDYLTCEWKAKMEGQEPRQFTKANMPGCSPKVQQQPNFSDCGIYLLQYVESFFRTPVTDYTLPITSLRHWFPEEEVRHKRAYIAELIRNLATTQNPGKELKFLDLQFHADNAVGGGADADGDEVEEDEVEDLEEGIAGQPVVSHQVKITAGPVPHMVRLTGATTTYSNTGPRGIHPGDRYHLLSKKGNQVRVTPITAFPVGVTVTPAGGTTPLKISHPAAVKIVSNIGGIQLVNRKMAVVSSSSSNTTEGGEVVVGLANGVVGLQEPPQVVVQTSPDSTSNVNDQPESLEMEVESEVVGEAPSIPVDQLQQQDSEPVEVGPGLKRRIDVPATVSGHHHHQQQQGTTTPLGGGQTPAKRFRTEGGE